MIAMSEPWWSYVQRVSAHGTNKDIAEAAQMDASTVTRWKQGDTPRAETVVAFARAYQRSPQEALIAAGYLTEDDLKQTVYLRDSLRDYPLEEIFAELRRRTAE